MKALAFSTAARLCVATMLLAACNGTHDRAESTAAAVLAADHAFARLAAREGAPYAFRHVLHDEAVLLPGAGEPRRTAAARTQWLRALEDALEWMPEEAWGSAAGDMGVTRGRWITRGVDAEGNPRVRRGNYVSVWRKDSKGEWKVMVDMRGEMVLQGKE